MNIILMMNTSPLNKINKAVSTVATLTGSLVDESSIVDPVILIESATLPAANYAQIPDFNGRYYYIRNIESVRDGLWRLTLHVDVLKTYASAILSNRAVISRSTNLWNLYLEDNDFKSYANPYIITKNFPSGFSTYQLVLALLGGHD